jgi:DNA-binding NarL/FixJ family response regulator
MRDMNPFRVLIADDHAILRAGVRLLINRQPDMFVIAEAQDAADAEAQCAACQPDVALIDLGMPGGGLQVIASIARRWPAVRVLVLSAHEESSVVRAALAAGALGYVTKNAADRELIVAIRAVCAGRAYLDEAVADAASDVASPPPLAQALLSERQQEVLVLIARGYTYKEIAQRLGVSARSVETYRERISEKLQLRSRADLVGYATAAGLLRDG